MSEFDKIENLDRNMHSEYSIEKSSRAGEEGITSVIPYFAGNPTSFYQHFLYHLNVKYLHNIIYL